MRRGSATLALSLLGVSAACGRIGYDGADRAFPPDATFSESSTPTSIARCGELGGSDTIALYRFEDPTDPLADTAGAHHGTLMGDTATLVAGPDGCGSALAFPSTGPLLHGVVPNSPDWDLAAGSIELWVRFDDPGGSTRAMGILGRDAAELTNGHLSLWLAPDATLMARLQHPVIGQPFLCSHQTVEAGRWHFVQLDFGPPAAVLRVDGVVADRTTPNPLGLSDDAACGAELPVGIEGNDQPWVLGASSAASMDGSAGPVGDHLVGAAIDEVRIRRSRVAGP